jgi:hypothetical protein
MGLNEVPDMTHIEEEKVAKTTYEQVDEPPKDQVENVNMNINTDNDGETVVVDETVDETTEETQPNVNINVSR